MDRCTGHQDTTEILLKTVLNTIQSINQPVLKGLPGLFDKGCSVLYNFQAY